MVLDAGGRRSERRKWVFVLCDAACCVYVASLADYNQQLLEDPATNALNESLRLFEDLATLPFLARTKLVLVLSKVDVLRARLRDFERAPPEKLAPFLADVGFSPSNADSDDVKVRKIVRAFSRAFLAACPARAVPVVATACTSPRVGDSMLSRVVDEVMDNGAVTRQSLLSFLGGVVVRSSPQRPPPLVSRFLSRCGVLVLDRVADMLLHRPDRVSGVYFCE